MDVVAVTMAVISSVDISALFAGSSVHLCAQQSLLSLSLSTAAWLFLHDLFACNWIYFGGVVDSIDGGGGSGLMRSSLAFWSTHGTLTGIVMLLPLVFW